MKKILQGDPNQNYRFVGLDVYEVSLVDLPANDEDDFIVVKRKTNNEEKDMNILDQILAEKGEEAADDKKEDSSETKDTEKVTVGDVLGQIGTSLASLEKSIKGDVKEGDTKEKGTEKAKMAKTRLDKFRESLGALTEILGEYDNPEATAAKQETDKLREEFGGQIETINATMAKIEKAIGILAEGSSKKETEKTDDVASEDKKTDKSEEKILEKKETEKRGASKEEPDNGEEVEEKETEKNKKSSPFDGIFGGDSYTGRAIEKRRAGLKA